jgi:hypothetical protein
MAVRRDGEIRSRLRSRLLRLVTRDEGGGPMGHSATGASDGLPASHGPLPVWDKRARSCQPASECGQAPGQTAEGLSVFHWHLQVGEVQPPEYSAVGLVS